MARPQRPPTESTPESWTPEQWLFLGIAADNAARSVLFEDEEPDIQDVVQMTMVQLWVMRKVVLRNPTAMARTIARRRAIDFIKKKGKGREALEGLAHQRERTEGAEVEAIELRGVVEELIDLLPPRQAEVVRYCLFDDLDDKTIARLMKISVETVKEHRRKGLARLRELLGETEI